MIHIEVRFFAHCLGRQTSCLLLLPNVPAPSPKEKKITKPLHPLLTLLHGFSDDHTIWSRRSSLERYVEGMGLAVAMPNGDLSFYNDLPTGLAYERFIGDELPRFLQMNFPLSPERADNFIAGFSMGGYGAFKQALSRPHRYAAAGSFAGVLDISAEMKKSATDFSLPFIESIFGPVDKIIGSRNDILHLLSQVKDHSKVPQLWQHCGKNDSLRPNNLSFRKAIKKTGIRHTYTESAGGHTWEYIDQNLPAFLNWLKPQIKPSV